MTTVLQVEASARVEGSLSRGLAATFRNRWERLEPDVSFIERDVGTQPPPCLSEAWIAAAFTPPAQRSEAMQTVLRPSDELIGEVARADVIVIATPMYNYGMPAALKAWFDQVIRINETFSFDLDRGDWPLRPMLSGKRLVVLAARGEFGFRPGGVREGMNHLEPHIATCSHYLGVESTAFVEIEYQEFGDHRHRRSVRAAHRRVAGLVQEWAGRFDETGMLPSGSATARAK